MMRWRRHEDERRLDDAANVLDLLVTVTMVEVGRLGGLAHGVEGDGGGDQIGAGVQSLGDDADGA